MRPYILVVTLFAAAQARAERPLPLAEAFAVAKKHRSVVTQGAIDVERASLNTLRAQLERIHLKVQASASEQLQDLNHQLTGTTVEFCASGLAGTACDTSDHALRGSADLTIPIWSGF